MAKILLVDDEPEVLRAVKVVMEVDCHRPTLLTDSRQALQRILAGDYDLAIVDLMMPAMTGDELLQKVKASRPDFPVILLSGTGDLFDIPRLMKLGAHDYLEKPFEPAALLELVRTAIRK